MDVEKLIKGEMEKYLFQLNKIESKYFYKIEEIKLKTGTKIQSFEEKIERMNENFNQKMNRVHMIVEDNYSNNYEKFLIQKVLLKHNNSYLEIKDLPTAISKIRALLTSNKFYEKKANQDEKLIKGLNNKLKQIVDQYSQLQETNTKLLSNFSIISSCA